MRTLLATWVMLAGCYDEAWVLPERDAVAIVREELAARGVEAGDTTRVIEDVPVCVEGAPCRTVTVALDGWDEDARVGFAYLASAERGLPHDTGVEAAEADAIQDELDARVATEGIVVVFRQWAHETEHLALEGFRRAVEAALDERGLTVQ